MAKGLHDDVLDGPFDVLIAHGNELVCCETEPTTYTQAHTTYKLADTALAGGDYTEAADTPSGRKVTIAAKNGVTVDTAGTANWVCINDTVNSKLLVKTTCNAQVLTLPGTVDFPAWAIHNPQAI